MGFTGSRRGGLALMAVAAARPQPIPVYAEMSSINPVVLLPGALKARGAEIASGFATSLTLGVGQFCTNPGLVVLIDASPAAEVDARAVNDAFVAQLVEALRVVKAVEGIAFITFDDRDVVRHKLVQQIVKAYDAYTSGSRGGDGSTT